MPLAFWVMVPMFMGRLLRKFVRTPCPNTFSYPLPSSAVRPSKARERRFDGRHFGAVGFSLSSDAALAPISCRPFSAPGSTVVGTFLPLLDDVSNGKSCQEPTSSAAPTGCQMSTEAGPTSACLVSH